MKKKLTAILLALTTAFAFGHGGVELGPNKGRLLEFSKDESMHGEVTVKDGKFSVALLDKDLKPVKVEAQALTATSAASDRGKAAKVEVTKTADGFSLPVVKEGSWLILQYKATPKSKAVTARFQYDTGNCEGCDKPEWLCECKPHDEKTEEKGSKKEEPKKEAGEKNS
jgi:hypothetical protein